MVINKENMMKKFILIEFIQHLGRELDSGKHAKYNL